MPLGPVFRTELVTTARRGRFYALRTIYGAIALFQVWVVYTSWERSMVWRTSGANLSLTLSEMAEFATSIFASFAFLQIAAVLFLTPSLVGGTIADERQRKTLHYLLTSELGGAEIVLGKLAARLIQLGTFLLLGLPIVSLIGLFGGVDPAVILATYAGTASSMYFLAAFSVLISTLARTPREAIGSLYLLGIGWLVSPVILLVMIPAIRPAWWSSVAWWLKPVFAWVAVSSPLYAIRGAPWSGGYSIAGATLWVVGMQLVYGSALAALAAWQLRPAFRRIEDRGGGRRFRNLQQNRAWLPRPRVGDAAMLWREMYASRSAGLTKLTSIVVGLGLFGLMIYTGYDFVEPVVREMIVYGWGDTRSTARGALHGYLVGVSVTIYVLWGLAAASAAAAGVTTERERDTWISLIATPMSGREILAAKMIGAAYSLRILAYLLLTLWTIGLALGALHPVGFVLGVVECAAFGWFVVALGTAISLRSRNTTRALGATMAILVISNGAYLACCAPFLIRTPMIASGCSPFVLGMSLFDYRGVDEVLHGRSYGWSGSYRIEFVACGVFCVVGYLIAAAVLTATTFEAFNAVADRPDRLRGKFRPPSPKDKPKPADASAGVLE